MSQTEFEIPDPNLFNEEEISQLVHAFYAEARLDPGLGPIFEAHVTDWDAHFVQMTNFWSMQLRGTGRFRGAPMPKHLALPELSASLFERWLQIFKQTTQKMENSQLQLHANSLAYRIASRLWMAYQMERHPDKPFVELRPA